jgi:hypothetical protein
MSRRRAGHTLAIIVGLLMAGIRPSVAGGEEKTAAARIEALANHLAKAQRLGVAVDCTYDVVQDSGQKIEFGERRELTLRRPDHVRVDVTRRDGSRRGLRFDGTQLTAFDLDEKVYATVSKPGTVDAALAYYTQDLKMRLPLRELFAADFPQKLKDVLGSAHVVGKETAVAEPFYYTLPCTPTVMALGGTVYYVCGSDWYIRAYSDGEVVYTMVPSPTGH